MAPSFEASGQPLPNRSPSENHNLNWPPTQNRVVLFARKKMALPFEAIGQATPKRSPEKMASPTAPESEQCGPIPNPRANQPSTGRREGITILGRRIFFGLIRWFPISQPSKISLHQRFQLRLTPKRSVRLPS